MPTVSSIGTMTTFQDESKNQVNQKSYVMNIY